MKTTTRRQTWMKILACLLVSLRKARLVTWLTNKKPSCSNEANCLQLVSLVWKEEVFDYCLVTSLQGNQFKPSISSY